ncbi:hypothetical protein [Rummeliibacillus suwonensis]|uniref:hypothetical protein n=1 Tax=Rummeliibacillus suwonensis TaxID=1306154 RepID=UPI0028997900|nr:hypothetical protein [Rummeliibacillus suwonensis]
MNSVKEFDEILVSMQSPQERTDFIRKYFFHGTPYVFNNRENEYFDFRNKISKQFNISFHEVFIVGSAKFGFSYIKKTEFSYESDIDIVLVNENLFDYYFEKICDYQYEIDRNNKSITQDEKNKYERFLRYLVKGWMRPDLLPLSFQVDLLKKDWFEFFYSMSYGKSEVGNYKVAGGLYRNYTYLEKYYKRGIEDYYSKLTM